MRFSGNKVNFYSDMKAKQALPNKNSPDSGAVFVYIAMLSLLKEVYC